MLAGRQPMAITAFMTGTRFSAIEPFGLYLGTMPPIFVSICVASANWWKALA